MSEQLLLNQQEYFSGQHTFKQDNNSVKTLDSDLAAQSTQNHTLMIAFYLDHSWLCQAMPELSFIIISCQPDLGV